MRTANCHMALEMLRTFTALAGPVDSPRGFMMRLLCALWCPVRQVPAKLS